MKMILSMTLAILLHSCADDPSPTALTDPAPKKKSEPKSELPKKPVLLGKHYVETVEFLLEESGAFFGPGQVEVAMRWCVDPAVSALFPRFELTEKLFGFKPRMTITSDASRLNYGAGWTIVDGQPFFPLEQDVAWPAELPEDIYQLALSSGELCAIIEVKDHAFQQEWLVNQGVVIKISSFLIEELATYGEIVLPPAKFLSGQNNQNKTQGHVQLKLVR